MKPWHMPLLATALALAGSPSRALQLVDARDGTSVEAVIAVKEPTRIRIENAPITDVFGNIYSSNCSLPAAVSGPAVPAATPAVNPAGVIMLECDRDKTARMARSDLTAASQGPLGASANHIRAMKALLVAMASERIATDMLVTEINRPVPLWSEATFALMRTVEGRGLSNR